MKKLGFSLLLAVGALSACDNGTPSASLKTDIDTLTYEIGLANSQGLKEYLVMQMGIDTTYMDEFLKGVKEGSKGGDDKKKAAYYAGIQIGQTVSTQMLKNSEYQIFGNDSTQHLNLANYLAGFISGVKNEVSVNGSDGKPLTAETARVSADAKMQSVREKTMLKQYQSNLDAGKAYIAKVAKEEGVKELANGIYYRVIKTGSGAIPKATDNVKINYEGRLIDGTVFDSSYKRGEPVELGVSNVIKGWTTVLTNMPVGSTWEVYIPQEMAYGSRETPQFKPFSAMIFKIELLGINAAK